MGELPKQAGFHGRARSFTVFNTQANCLNRGFSCQGSLCSQLISWTANKSTHTSAPVSGPRTRPERCCGSFLTWLLSSKGHLILSKTFSMLNLTCSYSPYSVCFPKTFQDLNGRVLSHKEKGYALNCTYRIMELSSCEGRTFCKRPYFS